MGKKPALGLIGLAWLGLAVGGCKSGCDCGDKSAQKPQQPRQRADNGFAKSWRQPKRQNAADQQQLAPEEGIAAKGANPRAQPAYNYDPSLREPVERGGLAQQVREVPPRLPQELTPENAAVTQKPLGAPELIRTGRTMETTTPPQTYPDAPAHTTPRPEGGVPPAGAGPDLDDVKPHVPPSPPTGEPMGGPAPPPPPSVEKVGTMPPPPPGVGTTGGAPTGSVPEYDPASMPTTSKPLSAAPPAPVAEAGAVSPGSGAVPPAPTNPVSDVPPPPPALQYGARENHMPPLQDAPQGTPQLPTPPAPTPEPIR